MKWAAIGLGLLAILLVSALGPLDQTPLLKSDYYLQTVKRLPPITPPSNDGAVVASGRIEAGFGKASITPKLGVAQDDPAHGEFRQLPLAGYGNRHGKGATGVHDELFAKSVAVRVGTNRLVFVGLDALIVPREVAEEATAALGSKLGLAREQIYYGATHSHCGPGGWGQGVVAEAFAGGFQPAARTWLAARIVEAATMACGDLKPASMAYTNFNAASFVRNRLVGELGRVDPQFDLLEFKQDGGVTGVIGSFAAHATVLSGSVMEFSADYPGYWRRSVEHRLGEGSFALFLAGAVGSHGPVAGKSGFEGAQAMGEALAAMSVKTLDGVAMTNATELRVTGLPVALPELHARISGTVRLRPWIASRLLPVGEGTFMQAARLGSCVWISAPCDFSGEIGLHVRNAALRAGKSAIITSFNGDYIGYVILPRYYFQDGYEPRTMSFFGPTIPEYFEDLALRLTER